MARQKFPLKLTQSGGRAFIGNPENCLRVTQIAPELNVSSYLKSWTFSRLKILPKLRKNFLGIF